jgi:putative transposase
VPAKNSQKTYLEEGIYHIYNRGVEKRDIFLDEQDFKVFLSYLKIYLSPKNSEELSRLISSEEVSYKEKDRVFKLLSLRNYYEEIDLLCYALMPNHFHLLIKQKERETINYFMRSLTTKYSMYFNKKYHRVGSLFQGVYKAVLVTSEAQLLHLSRYIHKNPPPGSSFPSSLSDYLGITHTSWLKPNMIMSFFNQNNPNNSYESFVREYQDQEFIASLALDFND